MANKEVKQRISESKISLEYLDENLTERIKDLHNVKGLQAERHAFIFYRSMVWDALRSLKDIDLDKLEL